MKLWNKLCYLWHEASLKIKFKIIVAAILLICICWKLISKILMIALILSPAIIGVIIYIKQKEDYDQSSYHAITHHEYRDIFFDKGKWQEWKVGKAMRKYEQDGAKLLFNAYIPKGDGTTEIDVLMISPYGLFVFESKNYGGWIFGKANQKQWTQTLRTGSHSSHKESFYNPIWQNATHINCLHKLLQRNILTHSVIVFSDRCQFKDLDVKDANADVLHISQVTRPVRYAYERQPVQLTPDEIQEIYDIIYPYTQVSEETKEAHIQQIEQMYR